MSRDKKQNDNSTDSTKIISYLIAIPIAFLFCVIDSCESCRKKDNYYGDISSNYSERVDENIHGAWAYATLFVERELYSPKSAKYGFAPAREAVTPLGRKQSFWSENTFLF